MGATQSIIRKCYDAFDIQPDAVFMDIGCGSGRALVAVTDYPFQPIIGIEQSDFPRNLAVAVRVGRTAQSVNSVLLEIPEHSDRAPCR